MKGTRQITISIVYSYILLLLLLYIFS